MQTYIPGITRVIKICLVEIFQHARARLSQFKKFIITVEVKLNLRL